VLIKPDVKKQLLVDKYIPTKLSDIIGHKESINQIGLWLQSWENGIPPLRGLLISGPPGIGKTTTIHLISKHFGYSITEYNASDSRSASMLKGLFALGIRRMKKELIIMDEVDGLSERGGVGEIAGIIKKTNIPLICICNEKPPKLKPLANVCQEIKFNRPVKSTIANAILEIAKKENIKISKYDLELLCEQNGNDIRAILNGLDFYNGGEICNKDPLLRMDLFSATQKLIGNTKISLDESANLVFVDYGMVPLMVQECYIASSKDSLEDALRASEFLSFADTIDKRIYQRQEWQLLPHYVNSVISATRTIKGHAPFQIFPQWLGKNSKRLKHKRWISDLSQKMNISTEGTRLDTMDALQHILLDNLIDGKSDIKSVIKTLDEMGLTRDDLMETIAEVCLEKVEIPTKIKTSFTREYNKLHSSEKKEKTKKKTLGDSDEDNDDYEEENEIDDSQNLILDLE
jgi:replication factor C subunit 1